MNAVATSSVAALSLFALLPAQARSLPGELAPRRAGLAEAFLDITNNITTSNIREAA